MDFLCSGIQSGIIGLWAGGLIAKEFRSRGSGSLKCEGTSDYVVRFKIKFISVI